jgi:hypothetical protein
LAGGRKHRSKRGDLEPHVLQGSPTASEGESKGRRLSRKIP